MKQFYLVSTILTIMTVYKISVHKYTPTIQNPNVKNQTSCNGSAVAICVLGQVLLLTNEHVIRNSFEISTQIGSAIIQLVPVHTSAAHDLALLKIVKHELTELNLETLEFADHTIGEIIKIIGFPNNSLNKFISTGLVGTLTEVSYNGIEPNLALIIEITANPGNSGCPIINVQNKIVGIVFGKTRHLCYAIPTTVIKHYIECFVSTKFIPQIGIYINKFNNTPVKNYYKNHKGEGILIKKSIYTTIHEGDYIITINHHKISNDGLYFHDGQFYPFWATFKSKFAGDTISIQVLRNGIEISTEITLESIRLESSVVIDNILFRSLSDSIDMSYNGHNFKIVAVNDNPTPVNLTTFCQTMSNRPTKLKFTTGDIMII